MDNEIVVFKSSGECKFFVNGPIDENELILVGVLDTIHDAVSCLLKGQESTVPKVIVFLYLINHVKMPLPLTGSIC